MTYCIRRLRPTSAVASLLAVCSGHLAAQETPQDAFRANIAAIHARDRAAYLSSYLQSSGFVRAGPTGLRMGYESFARDAGQSWPDTLVATHMEIVPVTPDVAYGAYRYRVVTGGVSDRGVSERVFVRSNDGWKANVRRTALVVRRGEIYTRAELEYP